MPAGANRAMEAPYASADFYHYYTGKLRFQRQGQRCRLTMAYNQELPVPVLTAYHMHHASDHMSTTAQEMRCSCTQSSSVLAVVSALAANVCTALAWTTMNCCTDISCLSDTGPAERVGERRLVWCCDAIKCWLSQQAIAQRNLAAFECTTAGEYQLSFRHRRPVGEWKNDGELVLEVPRTDDYHNPQSLRLHQVSSCCPVMLKSVKEQLLPCRHEAPVT